MNARVTATATAGSTREEVQLAYADGAFAGHILPGRVLRAVRGPKTLFASLDVLRHGDRKTVAAERLPGMQTMAASAETPAEERGWSHVLTQTEPTSLTSEVAHYLLPLDVFRSMDEARPAQPARSCTKQRRRRRARTQLARER